MGGPGAGVKLFDQSGGGRQLLLRKAGLALERSEVLGRQQFQMAAHQLRGFVPPESAFRHLRELQAQALRQAAGRHPCGIEPLNLPQHRGHGLGVNVERWVETGRKVINAGGENAVGIDGVNDDRGDHALRSGQPAEVQLPTQVVLQGVADGGPLQQVAVVGNGRAGR